MDGVSLGNNNTNYAIVDTGTSFMYLPQTEYDAFK
jgi:hypothetical protein